MRWRRSLTLGHNRRREALAAGLPVRLQEQNHVLRKMLCIDLAKARELHLAVRTLLAAGTDPMAERMAEKSGNSIASKKSFQTISMLWLKHWRDGPCKRHADTIERRMNTDILPTLGARPIDNIEAPEIVKMSAHSAPRADELFIGGARSSSNRSSDKPSSNVGSAASACAGWRRCMPNGSWSALLPTCSICFGTLGPRKQPEMRRGSTFGIAALPPPNIYPSKLSAVGNPQTSRPDQMVV